MIYTHFSNCPHYGVAAEESVESCTTCDKIGDAWRFRVEG